jgi:hypothetical protein
MDLIDGRKPEPENFVLLSLKKAMPKYLGVCHSGDTELKSRIFHNLYGIAQNSAQFCVTEFNEFPQCS